MVLTRKSGNFLFDWREHFNTVTSEKVSSNFKQWNNFYAYWWPLVHIIKHLFLPMPIEMSTMEEWQVGEQYPCQKYELLVSPSQSCSCRLPSPWAQGGQPLPWVSMGGSPDPLQGWGMFTYLQCLGEEVEAEKVGIK